MPLKLTPTQEHYLPYLLGPLSTKEISRQLSVTYEAVNKALYRICRSLRIEKTRTSLFHYYYERERKQCEALKWELNEIKSRTIYLTGPAVETLRKEISAANEKAGTTKSGNAALRRA